MDYTRLIEAGIDIVAKLLQRGAETGELSPDAALMLRDRAVAVFARYTTAPPPPIDRNLTASPKE